VRYATVLRIYDAVLGALARAVPEDIPAASGGQGCMVALSLPDSAAGRRHVTVIEPMIGGGGGRPARDGVDGCDASLGFLKTTPAETLEAEVPIVVRRFHLIPDSAGPGRFRGGFGVRLDFQVFQPEGLVTARGMERLRFAPWGVAGGTAGATGSVMLNPGTAAEKPLPKIDVLALEPGDVLSVQTPGGGGHGNRFTRPPSHVLADVLSGLVSRERASDAYGVVLDGDRVDEEATVSLRAAQSDRGPAGARTGAVFDFGTARREHEQRWPSELQDAFIAMLMNLPAPYRAYVRRTLYGRVEALATERAVTADDLRRLLNELRASIALK
jgi:N-methylhydantoinase B